MDRREKGWSLVKDDWDRIPNPIINKGSWSRVAFSPGANGAIPEKPGIYVIVATHPNKSLTADRPSNDLFGLLYTAVYVGETGDLRKRFAQHTSNQASEVITNIKNCFPNRLDFWWYRTKDKTEAQGLEPILQFALGPAGRSENLRGIVGIERPAF